MNTIFTFDIAYEVYVCTLLIMNFISTPLAQQLEPSPIVIDWSGEVSSDTANDTNIDRMLSWVRNYPRKSDVHVYLGKVRQRSVGKKLQTTLQAMGCRVTTRQYVI